MEFGDDYRNFLDSQSDCCSSSLSAANNLDSMSPPRNRKFIQNAVANSSKSPSEVGGGAVGVDNSLRRRRAVENVETEKKRKSSNGSRKMSSDGEFFNEIKFRGCERKFFLNIFFKIKQFSY